MVETVETLKEMTKRKAKAIVDRMQAKAWGSRFDFLVTGKIMSVIDGSHLNARLSSTKYTRVDGNLVILFDFCMKENERMAMNFETSEFQQEYTEMILLMKEYWESYAKLNGDKGVVFGKTLYFQDGWRNVLNEVYPLNQKDDVCHKIIEKKIGAPVLTATYSEEFKNRAYAFQEKVLNEWKAVVQEEPLLQSFMDKKIYDLFENELLKKIDFGSTVITISFDNENEAFDAINLRDSLSGEEVKIPMNRIDLGTYFREIKEAQRLINLIETPMYTYKSVMEQVMSSLLIKEDETTDLLMKREFEKMEQHGDWEFIELEMIHIEECINNDGLHAVIEREDVTNGTKLYLYKFQTKKYHYVFVLELVWNKMKDFALFCSEDEKNGAAKQYVIEKLTQNIDI